MVTATIFEAKTNLSDLLRQVQAGETVVITSGREKTPVAKLEAITPRKPQRLGLLYDPAVAIPSTIWEFPEEELRLWEEGTPQDPLNWNGSE